ncbi:3-dehydroquinase [Methanobrevibacter arboriphilus]|uniref:3-dehydroquinase n=1 Tax=Methanobrevibacter arboriphilus TaxID=39441 RepID=A0ACA8R0Q1_METAZ|nr:type I 3-dehydroquinate dehydratase [Methanobrevibacter arboriphilus]MCC7562802.1 type I 3-dehydroquinate dehydratase [Methanobrevibacter arboriphilus]BBL61071.1 3-dehydroquinase [Methanobrevibacter arboriphilus]GLI12603.1 3-dehydroquinase [Methanobrevibacter arboriphilus]
MISQTKIAIPILQEKEEDIINTAQDFVKKGADLLELRIDGIANVNSDMVKNIIESINFPVIATNRSKKEGGFFLGSEKERINILKNCCDLENVEYIDIELQTDPCLRNFLIDKCREANVKTIISFHDFEKTPSVDYLLKIVNEEKELGDVAKIAVMPRNLEDTINVLAIMSHCDNTIAISMGEIGSYTRVMASKFNAPFTFATGGDVTAPGQIDIETMKLLINMDLMDHDDLLDDI